MKYWKVTYSYGDRAETHESVIVEAMSHKDAVRRWTKHHERLSRGARDGSYMAFLARNYSGMKIHSVRSIELLPNMNYVKAA